MSDALKRIEEKHSGYHWCAEVSGIEWKVRGKPPCDVVKLARALDEALGHIACHPTHRWRRTLEEVAGEQPR